MSKKKDKDKKKSTDANPVGHASEVKRLRKENKELRARLDKIARLVQDLPEPDSVLLAEPLHEETPDVEGSAEPVVITRS